jgi:hypothetical protein
MGDLWHAAEFMPHLNELELPPDSDSEQNPVPQEILDALPLNTFTEQNKKNFSEENQLCTIC